MVDRATAAWERFWFAPQSTATLALVRIAVGLLALGWGLSLLPDLLAFFGSDGVIATQPDQGKAVWGLLEVFPSDAAVVIAYVILLAASVTLILGFWSRLSALLVFVALLSFARRSPWVLNSGDGLVRIVAFYLVLAPSGAALSLDRLRAHRDRFWEFPERAPWALRLIQIQVSVLYVSTAWQKVRGITWNDGTAVSYSLRIEDLERFPLPGLVTESVIISNLATFGTLAVELAIGVFVWNRVLRPWVLGLGLGLHLGIDYSIRVGFFSYALFAAYVAFVPPARAEAVLLGARDRIKARRGRAPAVRTREPEPVASMEMNKPSR